MFQYTASDGAGADTAKVSVTVSGGDLFVVSDNSVPPQILVYDGISGSPLGVFAQGENGLAAPQDMTIGPDGQLYATSTFTSKILKFGINDGSNLGVFIDGSDPNTGGGLVVSTGILFADIDGDTNDELYIANRNDHEILRYDNLGNQNPSFGQAKLLQYLEIVLKTILRLDL